MSLGIVGKIGMRSIGRNRRRTLVTTLAMGFAGFIMIFYTALMEGMMAALERNALALEIGELQMHADGYRKDPDLYKRIESPEEVVARLEARGFEAAPRLYGFGLAAAGVSSAGVQLRGVDVARERDVTQMHAHLLEGRWLDPEDPKGVVIGRKLAKMLRVKLGDEIVVLSQAADGSMANDLYRVRGVLKAIGEVVDRGGLLMPEAAFRTLMVLPEGTHEIVARRRDRSRALEEATAAAAKLAPEGVETMSWRELHPPLASVFDTSLAQSMFMLIITYAAIAMVVLNATLMSVFERIREFGVMKALGVSPGQVTGIVFVEVMTLTVLAAIIAVAFGVPVSLYFQTHGIDLSAIGGQDMAFIGVAFDPIWYTDLNTRAVVTPLVTLFVMVALAALYPGIKAAVIRPLDAIRHQ